MPVVVFGGQKGGTGKTALSINMAVCAQKRGRDVLLFNADEQPSVEEWAEARAQLAEARPELGHKAIDCVARRGDIAATLKSLSARYDWVFVDAAGAKDPTLASALVAASYLVSPFIPSKCDLNTAGAINHLVEVVRAVNPLLETCAVLSKCDPHVHVREREQMAACEQLEPFQNLPVLASRVFFRKPFQYAYAAALGVVEYADSPNSKVRKGAEQSVAELWRLYTEITGDVVAVKEQEVPHEVNAE
jgi:chromosome partitioning protein